MRARRALRSALFFTTLLVGCRSNTDGALSAPGPATGGPATGRATQSLHATPGGVDILTYHGDNLRTGWNRHETVLTPANVRPETFGQVAEARDVEGEITAQP